MKLHKILPIIFFMIAMMISCSQETVINENISGEAITPDTKICVNIKTENSRTVRPEITKWEIIVKNQSDTNLIFSRTIDGKATSATFVNVTDGEYDITVRGYNKDNKIILKNGSNTFSIEPNTVNVCEIIPEDFFEGNGNPKPGNLSIQISGLTDLFTVGETLLLTYTKLPETDTESGTTKELTFSEEGKISDGITEIPVGSYKIEITHNDEAKTKTKVNLVKDPVVNIYDNTTTEISWEWNYDYDKINTDQELKGIKIPVWNKSATATGGNQLPSGEYGTEYIPARNGYLTANALFAEPIWDEFYEFKSLKCTTALETGECTHDVTIEASEFDFINCAYDNIGNLWVLSSASEIKIIDNTGTPHTFNGLYVLKNLSTGDDYKFSCSDSLAQDFTVFDDGTNKYLIVSSMSDNGDGDKLKSFKLSDTKIEDFEINSPTNLANITALYISRNSNTDEIPIYIAITSSDDNGTTANIYTGTISTGDTLTLDININQPLLSLGISNFTATIQNSDFSNNAAFMITDMYINEDKSKLYVTAGCVNYNYKSWRGNSDDGSYHSFGGLFEYTFGDNGELVKDEDNNFKVISYGINNNYDVNNPNTPVDPENENEADPNPFLQKPTDGSDNYEVESNIIQATSDDSPYFAGPRYIIPSGNDLLIVDSGFYGMYKSEYKQLTDCEKRNRIFTFDPNAKEKLSLTTLDDSISFDYDYLTSSRQY